MTIYIVILHYGKIKNTLTCLESVAKLKRDRMTMKVILVDNDEVHKVLKGVDIIRNSSNLGFAAGINVGIREALKDRRTDYVLILNNDTIVPPDLLIELLKTPSDIISPVIKYKTKTSRRMYDYGGRINWWIGRAKHIEFESRIMNYESRVNKIDYVSGCCMLIKREVFEKVGLFDPAFFMYFEDADFCTRAKKEGFRIKVNPQTVIDHLLAAAIGRGSSKAIFQNLRGNFIFITKHLGWRRPIGYFYLLFLSGKILFNYLKRNNE